MRIQGKSPMRLQSYSTDLVNRNCEEDLDPAGIIERSYLEMVANIMKALAAFCKTTKALFQLK